VRTGTALSSWNASPSDRSSLGKRPITAYDPQVSEPWSVMDRPNLTFSS
jgi:hypothetical protein